MLGLPTFDELKTATAAMPAVIPEQRTFSVIASAPVRQKKTKVGCYVRVSTQHEDQKSSISIQRQHFLSRAAEHEDWEFAGIYCDIVSGTKKEKRPELQRLLKDCEAGKVQLVLTKSISRFARNTTDLLEMIRRLTALGAAIIFERENIDTRTMDSEFLLTLLASLAEDESHSISSNCRWGIQRRFQDGTYKISTAPYGYDVADGKLVVNGTEAEVVREIFSLYLAGSSLRSIAEDLTSRGIPTKRAGEKQKDGRTVAGRWTAAAIGSILDSETYTGDMILQKTYKDRQFNTRQNDGKYPLFYVEEDHPPIIEKDVYEAVKVMRSEKRKTIHARTAGNVKHIFTSALTCGCCGARLYRQKTKSGAAYWICREHREKADACPLPPVPEESIRKAFLAQMSELHENDSLLRLYISAVDAEWHRKHGEKLTALEGRRTDLQKKLPELESARGQMGDYLERRNRLRWELLETEASLEQIKDKRIILTEELLQSVHGWDSSFPFDENTFHRLVEGVTANGKEEFVFRFRCGFEAGGEQEEQKKTA